MDPLFSIFPVLTPNNFHFLLAIQSHLNTVFFDGWFIRERNFLVPSVRFLKFFDEFIDSAPNLVFIKISDHCLNEMNE